MSEMIRVERELVQSLRELARKELGPEATEEEVERRTNKLYGLEDAESGPHRREETPEERKERKERSRQAIERVKKWGLPEL